MKFNEHCNLCDNLKSSLQDGIICNLTNQKPNFDKICSKIHLGEKFEKQLAIILINIEELKKKKQSIYIQFFLLMVLGCILIISQINLFTEFRLTYSSYITTITLSLLVIIIGFGLCGFAYNRFNRYRKKTKIVKADKNRIDTILNKYQIQYFYSVEFGEKYHGQQDIIVELRSESNLLENSKITYQI